MSDPMPEPTYDPPESPMSLHAVVGRFVAAETNHGATNWADLEAALVEREEAMADILRLAGAQFGLFPEIVAEVLAQVGIGRPISTEQRAMIHANFHALMERLQSERGDGQ